MALKPNRIELPNGSRIKYFVNEVVECGGILIHDGSGEGMDDPDATLAVPGSGSGVPAGVLMNDVVNLDLTRQHLNQHRDEVQVGNKVDIIRNGWISTNMLAEGDTPAAGDPAHYTAAGLFTTDSDQVGRFVSGVDVDGYVEVEVDIR